MTTGGLSCGVAPYGALELKSEYQKHLFLGLIIALLFHLAIVGGAVRILSSQESVVLESPIVSNGYVVAVVPPTMLLPVTHPISSGGVGEIPSDLAEGIPTLFPDELIKNEVVWARRVDLERLANSASGTFDGTSSDGTSRMSIGIAGSYEELGIQDPSVFIPVDEQPVMVDQVNPEYPEIARLTETEGTVWIKAFVDESGTVIKVLIAKSSGGNAGFDDAAMAAAYKCRYKPAIQNGLPVGVWVTYVVEFTIK